MSAVEIDVYSDIVCPWCFIGVRRLHAAIASFGAGLSATVHHRPYLLHPDAPPDGLDLRAMLAAKYGADPQRMFERVEAVARDEGIPLDFSRQTRTYATIGAHTLLRHAAAIGTQSDLADALFSAYFLDGRNIADPAVLTGVAREYGFSPEEALRLLRDEREIAQTRRDVEMAIVSGIRGVPVFLLDGQYAIQGAQPKEAFRAALIRSMAN